MTDTPVDPYGQGALEHPIRRPPPPSHAAEAMATRLILDRDTLLAARAHVAHCELVLNKAWEDARAQGAEDWNGMNRVLRDRNFYQEITP